MITVQELIDMLSKIENKNQRVVVSDGYRDILADVVKLFQRRDCLVIDKTGIEGTGVYFNHRSNNPMVKTYENGFCDIGTSEVMYWCEVPKFETKKK